MGTLGQSEVDETDFSQIGEKSTHLGKITWVMEKSLKTWEKWVNGFTRCFELENEHPRDWNWFLTPLLLQDQFFQLDY